MTPYWVLIQWTALLILSYVPLSVHSSVLANTAFNATDSVIAQNMVLGDLQ